MSNGKDMIIHLIVALINEDIKNKARFINDIEVLEEMFKLNYICPVMQQKQNYKIKQELILLN